MFGVFDGHGGADICDACQKGQLYEHIADALKKLPTGERSELIKQATNKNFSLISLSFFFILLPLSIKLDLVA